MTNCECAICQDRILPYQSIIVLSCEHVYHETCIISWIHYKKNCPTCRCAINILDAPILDISEEPLLIPPRVSASIPIPPQRRNKSGRVILCGILLYIITAPLIVLMYHYFEDDMSYNFTRIR